MSQVSLECNYRDNSGKGVARKLRAAGRIPGVLYGGGIDPVKIDVEEKTVQLLLKKYGLNPIITLTIGGHSSGDNQHVCMVADYQRDVFQRDLLHLDLQRIDLKKPVHTTVPLRVHGVAEVRARGGISEQKVDRLDIATLPLNIPTAFDVDITGYQPGDRILASELEIPEGVTLLHGPDEVIVNVSAPRKAAEAAGGEGEQDAGAGESEAAGEAAASGD